jgi:DNA mismatch endonuclease (patch repair protein)
MRMKSPAAAPLTDAARSAQMRLIRSKDTKPELAVRRALFALGYRYRLHYAKLPGKPDLVLPARRKAIFIHGCFWHRHSGCKKTRLPKSRLEYWEPKFAANVVRDLENQAALRALGWRFMVVWECELHDLECLTRRIVRFLEE